MAVDKEWLHKAIDEAAELIDDDERLFAITLSSESDAGELLYTIIGPDMPLHRVIPTDTKKFLNRATALADHSVVAMFDNQ